MNLQLCAVARLQAQGWLDPQDGGQVIQLVEDLQRLLPEMCISSARVMRYVRAAQDRVFDEAVRTAGYALLRRATAPSMPTPENSNQAAAGRM